jgi:hypothetical protein
MGLIGNSGHMTQQAAEATGMSDEELCKGLRLLCFIPTTQAADRIEALTEQLEAARADAKEAEAYAEELAGDQVDLCRQLIAAEDKLATCEKYRDAYAECDRIGTQAVRDLEARLSECEARLGKAVEALREIVVDDTWGLDHKTYMNCRKVLREIEGEQP